VLPDHGRFIPDYVTYESLHGTDSHSLNPQCNKLNGLPFNLTQLADKVPAKVLAPSLLEKDSSTSLRNSPSSAASTSTSY